MALLECRLFSRTLNMATSINVCLPTDVCERPARGFPVVYLLHGYSDDHSIWVRRTCVDRYAADRGVAVVMPEVQHSFYTDQFYGLNYFAYVAEELPRLCRAMFPLSGDRRDTMVAGLSMGGYGALKCALSKPETFSACVSLSGAVDIAAIITRTSDTRLGEFKGIFGPDLTIPEEDDLYALAARAAKLPEPERPRVMTACGTEDFLYEDNRKYRDYLRSIGWANRYEEGPGAHEWAFWEKMLPATLDFLLEGRG